MFPAASCAAVVLLSVSAARAEPAPATANAPPRLELEPFTPTFGYRPTLASTELVAGELDVPLLAMTSAQLAKEGVPADPTKPSAPAPAPAVPSTSRRSPSTTTSRIRIAASRITCARRLGRSPSTG